ncbi:hypothetical protein AWI43_32415 [Streptomyces sp. WAC04657]|nr:hypothetical protein AWI43_32415 [Streptomyces sp. WAC04657]
MLVQSVPVSHSPSKRPVYRLVFATRRSHGLWVFGDAVARARAEWWKNLEEREEGTLFSIAPDPKEVEAQAKPEIAENLARLLDRGYEIKLVDYPLEIFGSYYGQVTEPVVRQAVQLLHKQGRTPSNGKGVPRTRNIVLRPGPRQT